MTPDGLHDLTRRLYRAMSSGDADAIEALYSTAEDVCFIGSSADEFWTDPLKHNADVRPYFDGTFSTRVEPGAMATAVACDGAAWIVDTPSFIWATGRHSASG
jgi:hypothetical protein